MSKIAFFLTFFACCMATELPFCIVVPSYNNEDWVEQNLDSIFDQEYGNYRVIYVVDGSTDRTEERVRDLVKKRSQEHRFTLIVNGERSGPLACMCQAVFSCEKEEIVVDLDGNDWLAHKGVLACLNQAYSDSETWMTYGQFLRYPSYIKGTAFALPDFVVEEKRFRSFGGAVTHLKTFYASLFQSIDKKDFLIDGEFFQKAGDLAYTIPLLEMAGKHSRFIPEVLYVYNGSAPLNENKVPNALEEQMDQFIRSKTPYAPLSSLPKDVLLPVYEQIENLVDPKIKDYQFIQDYLTYGKREKLFLLKDMEPRMRSLKIVGETPDEFPLFGQIAVNCNPEDRGNCILIYSTFNNQYPKGLQRLIKLIQASDFKGHILYRLGGWPNVGEGALRLSHVPYAFKISFFEEAKKLGFRRALWLDTSVIPLVSPNVYFERINKHGVFVIGNRCFVGPYTNPEALLFFGLKPPETFAVPSCSGGLFGVDFTNPLGKEVLRWWKRAALDKEAFYSARSDQNVLSLILYKLGVTDFISADLLAESFFDVKPDSLFCLDRHSVLGLSNFVDFEALQGGLK